MSESDSSYNVDDSLYLLQLNFTDPILLTDLNANWTRISSINPFELENRVFSQFAVLSDGKRFIINGGRKSLKGGYTYAVNETIMYDSVQNIWQKLPDSSRTNMAQVAFGTAVDFQTTDGEAVGFFGGLTISSSCNAFTNFTIFNLSSQEWSYFSPQKNLMKNIYINDHTATLNPKTGKIYYLGGQLYQDINCNSKTPIGNDFTSSYVFDTKKGEWKNQPLGGARPGYRIYPTATLGQFVNSSSFNTPDSQNIILVGGMIANTLGLEHKFFVCIPAVLVDTTLFIMFGLRFKLKPNNDMVALNVSDIKNITQIDAYPYPLPSASNNSSSTTSSSTNPADGSLTSSGKAGIADGSLTSGGKAGTAVGTVIGAATIVAVVFYVYRRRKRSDPQGEDTQSYQLANEEIYVDWDKIESQYREIQLPALQTSSSHASLELPRITPDEVTDVSPKFQEKSKLSQTPDVND
ncbi:hypothetical protein G6F60_001837 [Rhizopus arrhizus]|nr:hypothetical protein G6F61_001317 [Rhizopus arrhizus]KAG1407925.1 hypothetical protein G6F60_001837 [Rhizopus arrhizus]